MTEGLLPNRLSELVQVALKDFETIENNSNFEIDMSEWCTLSEDSTGKKCYVCLAGCVMVGTLKIDPFKDLTRDYYNNIHSISESPYYNHFLALNFVRQATVSSVMEALITLNQDNDSNVPEFRKELSKEDFPFCTYSKNQEQFKFYLTVLIDLLKKHNL